MTSKLIAGMLATAALCAVSSPATPTKACGPSTISRSAKVKPNYGVALDQAWLDQVRGAAVRLIGGCSASVSAATALVLTNNHCVADCAQNLSTARATIYFADGYHRRRARARSACPGMQAEDPHRDQRCHAAGQGRGRRLTGEAAGQGARRRCRSRSRRRLRRRREDSAARSSSSTAAASTSSTSTASTPTSGWSWRRACQAAFFGGDPDNFNFPRYDLDASFLRALRGRQAGRDAAITEVERRARRSPASRCSWPAIPAATERLLTIDQLETAARPAAADDPACNFPSCAGG